MVTQRRHLVRPIHRLRRPMAVLIASGLLVACGPPAAIAPTPAPVKPAPPAVAAGASAPTAEVKPAHPEASGSITIVLNEEPPLLASSDATANFSFPVLRNIEEALLNRDPKTSELVPELATKWEQTSPTVWRFELRKGVKFHDGSPFNAEAAAAALNHLWSKENNFRVRSYIGPELEFKAADDHTLEVITASPDPILPTRMYFAVLHSPKALKETPEEYPLRPIGTGPYRFVEWVKGQHIKLEANPDWWGRSAPDANGTTSIKDVVYRMRPERDVRAAMVKQGEADLARWVSREQCNESPQCTGGPGLETLFLRMDTMNPVFADRRIREAVALAIDKEAIMKGIMGGGELAAMMVVPSVLGFNPELRPYPYDPERARQLVAEAKAAGVPVDATPLTMIARRGFVFRIEEASESIVEMLRQVGINGVKVQVLEAAAHTELWNAPKPIDPARGLLGFHSHGNELMDFSQTVRFYYACDGRQSAYCNPIVEEMHKNALPLKGAEREKAYQALAKYLYDEIATVPVGHQALYFGMSKRLNWTPRVDGLMLVKEMKLKE